MDNSKVLELKRDIKWIGILDPTLVTFDVVMETQYGTSYNSYFIDAEKKTIVETSKDKYRDSYIEKVKSVVDPSEIEYIILNHTEPDHSGNLKELLKLAPNATVVASKIGIKFLKDIVNDEFDHIIVADGDTLDLGNKTIRFIGAPFLHWPDTMYSYLEEDRVLFTCDSFGCHYCDENIFDDKVGDFGDAFKYYFDVIMSPFSQHMLNAINKVRKLKDIDIIAPGHGPVLRDNWEKWVDLTEEYAEKSLKNIKEGKPSVFIPYVSAYGNTKRIAELICRGLKTVGDIEVELMDIEDVDISLIESKIERSDAILIGTPTINQNTFPQIYQLFGAINPITNRGKIAGSFGSYGWSGEAVGIVNDMLKSLKLKPHGSGLKVLFVPEDNDNNICTEFGREIGEKLLEKFS